MYNNYQYDINRLTNFKSDYNYDNEQNKVNRDIFDYTMNNNYNIHDNQCLKNSSEQKNNGIVNRQSLVDLESDLLNRNMKKPNLSKSYINVANLSNVKPPTIQDCSQDFSPLNAKLFESSKDVKYKTPDRFYNMPDNNTDIMDRIFWDYAVYDKLFAVDNYKEDVPTLKDYNKMACNHFYRV